MKTNGLFTRENFELFKNYINAYSIDIKGYHDTYAKLGVSLDTIYENISRIQNNGTHLEIAIPIWDGHTDYSKIADDLQEICDSYLPIILMRGYGKGFNDSSSPNVHTLETIAREFQERGFHFVYVMNVLNTQYENTVCPSCGAIVVERHYGLVVKDHHGLSRCRCGQPLNIIRTINDF